MSFFSDHLVAIEVISRISVQNAMKEYLVDIMK